MALQFDMAAVFGTLLVGLRVMPVFMFAPPFSLIKLPTALKPLLGLGLAIPIYANAAVGQVPSGAGWDDFLMMAPAELLTGLFFALVFQLTFAALYMVGRTIDIQAGYGLALLIDPTSRGQTPLTGTMLALLAGMMFFVSGGHIELYGALMQSYAVLPLGVALPDAARGQLLVYFAGVMGSAMAVSGLTVLAIFLVDIVIAALSRTVPQMNALMLGFQVKAIVFLVTFPLALGVSAALLFRMMREMSALSVLAG